jgi:hypothetical protein
LFDTTPELGITEDEKVGDSDNALCLKISQASIDLEALRNMIKGLELT